MLQVLRSSMTEKAPQDKKVFDLTDVYDEQNGRGWKSTDGKSSQPVIVIDGRGYERMRPEGANIHDLTDVVEDRSMSAPMNDLVMKRAEEMIEKIAREIVPVIAERVIREEIAKITSPQMASKSDQT